MAEQRHALNCSQRVFTEMTFSITKQNVVTGNKIAALSVLLFFFFIKIESLHSDDSKIKQFAYEYCARYFKSALRTEVMECKKSVYNNRFSSSMFTSPDDHKYALEDRHSAGQFLGQ